MIKVKNLNYSYPKAKERTLKDINFHIAKGEIFGFLGPSGAGKSTTQKILIGLLKNYTGSVEIMGQEIKNINPDFYEKIGVSFELPNLFNKFTGLENLQFFSSLYRGPVEKPESLLKMVGLDKYAGVRVFNYSKGMKMRLNFCRAFLNRPEIIFLDEPTSGLDPVNAKTIKDMILQKKAEGKTIFLTTHNMEVADQLCDRVAFIVDGRIILIDAPRELKVKMGKKRVNVEYREKGGLIKANYDIANIGYNEEFLKLLREKDIETIHTEEATLEDIFIKVTGRTLKCEE